MSVPRFGLIGARRVHQGLGPFIARDIAAAGGEVACVLGRTQASADEAADAAARLIPDGTRPMATALEDDFFAHKLDAVCVLTPAGTHGDFVEAALARGCHVLAEKPFLWFPETDWAQKAESLEDRFAEAGLLLETNAQWPWTLAPLERALGRGACGTKRLAMGQQPASQGIQMIGDSAPHPLSLAQAIAPDITEFTSLEIDQKSADEIHVHGTLRGERSQLEIEMQLDGRPLGPDAGPRQAWIEIDGIRVDRCIRPRDYALFFRRGGALFDLPDPLTLRLADFVGKVRSRRKKSPSAPDRTISRRAALLKSIVDAFQPLS